MEEALIKRVMPHSIEAEQSVVGAMLMDKDAITAASEMISGSDFYQSAYGVIFDSMVELFNEGKPVDLITLQERLREKEVPAEIASLEFVRDLVTAVPTSANIKYYAQIVADKSMMRRLIKLNEEIENVCYAGKEPLEAVLEDTKEYNIPGTAVCLMGHGTTDRANAVYEVCQRLLKENGYDRYFIGTVEADPTLDQVVQKVEKGNYRRVVLQPFMLVAGDHANQDMAGMGKNSWKTTFEAEGYEVVCRIRGLGELPGVRRIYVRHAKEAARAIL